MKGLDINHVASLSMISIDISWNRDGSTSSITIANWISNMSQSQSKSALSRVIAAGCSLDIFVVLQSIRNSVLYTLLEIDISSNKMDKVSTQAVTHVLENTPCLQKVNFFKLWLEC